MHTGNDWAVLIVHDRDGNGIGTFLIRKPFEPDAFQRALFRALKYRVSSVIGEFGSFVSNLHVAIHRECGGQRASRVDLIPIHAAPNCTWTYRLWARSPLNTARGSAPRIGPALTIHRGKTLEFQGGLFQFTGKIKRRIRGYGNLDNLRVKYRRGLDEHRKKFHTAAPASVEKSKRQLEDELRSTRPDLVGIVTPKAKADRSTPRKKSRASSRE